MSTAYSSAKQKYIGNGVTTEWGFDFPIQKHSELKVYLKRSGMPQVLLEEGVDYSFVTENTIAFPIKTGEAKLQATDVLALQRESVFESEYNFSNQQRLEPEEVMHADDNLERQIQELKRDSESAIKVQPTSNINTDEYFIAVESIYENLDNITNVSGISAEIVNCSDNISDISTVSSNISNVNAVGQSISSVNTVASNVSSVNTVAGVSTDVTTVAGISTDVSTVANNSSNVTTVATNISDVNTAASNMAAIQAAPTAAANAAQSAANAANSATISANSAIWAEGTDAQVQALGGVHSSKGWAEQSTNANISLTNTPYTTNRILEIPQDIKPELNNGALTLKAGSKVYVPNGFESDGTTPKFDEVVISADKTGLQWVDTNIIDYMLFCEIGGGIDATRPERCTSGTSYPSSPSNGDRCYRTDLNRLYVYRTGSSSWIEEEALPLGIVRSSGTAGKVGSIDQVFNGFGYIGSTVFALPGVRGLNGKGKQTDGTFLTEIREVKSVLTTTVTAVSDRLIGLFLYPVGEDEYGLGNANSWELRFSYEENCMYSGSTKFFGLKAGEVYYETTPKLSLFIPVSVDSIVNSNASNFSQAGRSYLSGLGMPSGRYIDLTLGASGTSYTAPANGYFVLWSSLNSGQYTEHIAIHKLNQSTVGSSFAYESVVPPAYQIPLVAPVKRGEIIHIAYTIGAAMFRFYYAEGENNV